MWPLIFFLQLLWTSCVVMHANLLLLPIHTTEPTFDALKINVDRVDRHIRNYSFRIVKPNWTPPSPNNSVHEGLFVFFFRLGCHAHPQKPSHVIYYTGFIPCFSSWRLCLKLPLQGTPDSTPCNETASVDNMQIFRSPLSTEFWQCRSAGLAQAPAIHHYQPQPMQSHLGRTLLHRLPAN